MQYRNTRQRKIVLEAVQEHHDHPSADQIYLEIRAKDPKISRGTVYRNLNILSEEGQITHVKVPGADRYDCRTDFHYHLICTAAVQSVMPRFHTTQRRTKRSQRNPGIGSRGTE